MAELLFYVLAVLWSPGARTEVAAPPHPAPSAKLRTGRPWPRFHYTRLPSKGPASERTRGFWRAR